MARNQLTPPTRQGEIADVAARLFNERGFARTSMEDIADAMGIKKPTLYHYVQSKAQIVGWIHEECVNAVHPALKSYVDDGLPAEEILYLAFRDILSLLAEKPGYLRVYFENHRDLDESEQTRIVAMRDEYSGMIRTLLKVGADAGQFVIDDPNIATFAYFSMCNWAYQWYHVDGPMTTDEVALHLWRIYINGIAAHPEGQQLRFPPSLNPALAAAD